MLRRLDVSRGRDSVFSSSAGPVRRKIDPQYGARAAMTGQIKATARISRIWMERYCSMSAPTTFVLVTGSSGLVQGGLKEGERWW